MDLGADMTLTNKKGFNALIASLISLDVKFGWGKGDEVKKEFIFKIIESGVDIHSIYQVNEKSHTTALIEAACDGYLDVVKKLVEMGASFELNGDKGKEALLRAAYTCRYEVLQYLLEIGADATTIDSSLVFYFYNYREEENKVMELLRKHGAVIPVL